MQWARDSSSIIPPAATIYVPRAGLAGCGRRGKEHHKGEHHKEQSAGALGVIAQLRSDRDSAEKSGWIYARHYRRIHEEVVEFAKQEMAATALRSSSATAGGGLRAHNAFCLNAWFEDAGAPGKAPLAVAAYKYFVSLIPLRSTQGGVFPAVLTDTARRRRPAKKPFQRTQRGQHALIRLVASQAFWPR